MAWRPRHTAISLVRSLALKRKDKTDSTKDYLRRRRAQFRPWLRAMGLDGLLSALSPEVERVFLTHKNPPPDIWFDDAPSWWPKLHKEIEAHWRRDVSEPFGNGHKLPTLEAMTIYPMLIAGLSGLLAADETLRGRFGDPPPFDYQVVVTASQTLGKTLLMGLRCVAGIDGVLIRIQTPSLFRNEKSRMQLQWRVTRADARQERLKIHGRERPIYRLADPCEGSPLEWTSLDPAVLGLSDPKGKLPVYIQSHALKRLYERLKFWPDGWTRHMQWCNTCFQSMAAASMSAPRVARRSGQEFLVDYRIADMKLGYLVCELIGRKVIIKTFFLSGMEGTPEGDLVRKKLRLTKSQIQWLGMDRLEEWSTSDVRFDPAVRLLLEECGLSDLLRYADGHGNKYFTELAGTFRKFIGESRVRQAMQRVNDHPQSPALAAQPQKLPLP